MILQVYRTTGRRTRSLWLAELIAEVETDRYPDDPQAFADEYGGDIIDIASVELLNEETFASGENRE